MKVYQIIYTYSNHSIVDEERGFVDKEGYGIYSFSKGLTKDEINSAVKFMNYRLPNEIIDDDIDYPVVFRTFTLPGGKTACVQSTYSTDDIEPRFLSHAFLVEYEEGEKELNMELMLGSPSFIKKLTDEQFEAEEVGYLPELDTLEYKNGIEEKIEKFIKSHRREMSYLLEKMLTAIASVDKYHTMLASTKDSVVEMCLVSLKYMLPNPLANTFGISTYNVNIPPDKQKYIRLHGTRTDFNNITESVIDAHPGTVYIDLDEADCSDTEVSILFDMGKDERDAFYAEHGFQFASQLLAWINANKQSEIPQLTSRLKDLRDNCSKELYVDRVRQILPLLNEGEYKAIKFEFLDSVCRNIKLFDEDKEAIVIRYASEGFKGICDGEAINLENMIMNDTCIEYIYKNLPEYMQYVHDCDLNEKNGMLLLRDFALMKRGAKKYSWKEFFGENDAYIIDFLEMCAVDIINNSTPITFFAPENWTNDELGEVIALFDSSTSDKEIKRACKRFIISNPDVSWGIYGVLLQRSKKSEEEIKQDVAKIRSMLSSVGYAPFTRNTYRDLKFTVNNEMNIDDDPILIIKLLSAFYSWQSSEGKLSEAKVYAEMFAEYILELRQAERSVYNFIFPKLAIEILNSPGHFHELMINADTMYDEFWNWFLVAYYRLDSGDPQRIVYSRVFEASEPDLKRLPLCTMIHKTVLK